MSNIALLSIGNELLDGRTTDTNATYLGEALRQNDHALKHILKVRDSIEEIRNCLDFLSTTSSVVIVSGGLGPTSDDLTRQALAEYCEQELILDDEDLIRLRTYFSSRKRDFPEANKVQSYFPERATIIENPIGTASGFIVEKESLALLSLPGVPKEFRGMVDGTIIPFLQKRYPDRIRTKRKSFRTFDMPESKAAGIITSCKLEEDIDISYRAHFPELGIQLSTKNQECDLDTAYKTVREKIGEDFIYTEDVNRSLPEQLSILLKETDKTISLAESCTAGSIAKALTDFDGSSAYFLGGAVTYSNEAKSDLVHVLSELIEKHGAVSHEVAKAMADGARERFKSDMALSVTGIAGPNGGSKEKPVGTFFVGLSTESQSYTFHHFFAGERALIRKKATYNVLDTVRRFLLGLPFTGLETK